MKENVSVHVKFSTSWSTRYSVKWSYRMILYAGGDAAVYVFDINQPSLPTPVYSVLCVCFCLYGPLNCISFHKFSRQLFAFSLCPPGLISVLLVLSAMFFFFMKVSFSPDIVLCGWLGLKHILTNELTKPLRDWLCWSCCANFLQVVWQLPHSLRMS